jgi:tetratricopeptide (TPR) repeat protein
MKEHPIAAGTFLIVVAGGIGLFARAGIQSGAHHEKEAVRAKLNQELDEVLNIARQEDYETAIQRLEKMIDDHPDMPGLYLNLGIAQRAANKLDDADRTFARVLELDPSDYDAMAERANIQKEKGNLEAALDILEKIPEGEGRLYLRLKEDPLWIEVAENPRMKALKEKHGAVEGTDTSLHIERMRKKNAPQGVAIP